MINIVEYVKFLAKHNLTSNQFLILSLTKAKRFDLLYEYIHSLMENSSEVWNTVGALSRTEIDDLIKKGLVLNLNKEDNYYLDQFTTTDKFDKMFKTVDFSGAVEFWTAYPQVILVDGKKYNAKNVNKDEFLLAYTNSIGNSKELHNKVLITLKDHIEKGLIKSKIDKWFNSKPWEDFVEDEIKPKSDVI
jgi:hypothetical protein